MPMEEEPVVGAIYEDADGLAFEVLSFDEDEGAIEVQYADGSVDEIDLDAWYEMDLHTLKSAPWKDEEDEEADEEDRAPPKRAARDDSEDDDDLDDYDEDYDDEEE